MFRLPAFTPGPGPAHVDDIPNDLLILRAGYRYGREVGDNDNGFREHRLLADQILRKYLPGDLLLTVVSTWTSSLCDKMTAAPTRRM